MTEQEVLDCIVKYERLFFLRPEHFEGRRMTIAEMVAIFNHFDAFWQYKGDPHPKKPHVLLKSLLHSNGFIVCKFVLECPRMCLLFAHEVLKAVEERMTPEGISKIDVVVSSAYSSISLGWEVARLISERYNPRVVYKEVEKDKDGNPTIIRGGIDPDKNVLVINELMTTGGGSTFETRKAALTCNGDKPGPNVLELAFVLVHRSKDLVLADGSAVHSVFHFDIKNFEPDDCDYCKVGSEAIKPKTPKENWGRLHGRA